MPTITPWVVKSAVSSRTSSPVRWWVDGVDQPAEEQLSHAAQRSDGRGYAFRVVAFTGFPPAAFEFYDQLEADNTKVFWQANKATFDAAIKEPTAALCEELADIGPFHVFRPYNDVRFAKNRPPYKTHQGAYCESEGGSGYYFHIGADGLLAGVGYYSMAKDQLERFRAAIDDDTAGSEVERITAALVEEGLLDRRHGRAEDGTAWLRQGPPARRAAAAQGPDGVAAVPGGGVDAQQEGGHQAARDVDRRAAAVRLAGHQRRPVHPPARRVLLRPPLTVLPIRGFRRIRGRCGRPAPTLGCRCRSDGGIGRMAA